MLNARATTLRADKAYIDLLEAESTWPSKYVFSRTNPVNSRQNPMWGLTDHGVPGARIGTYNKLLPTNFRMQVRAAQNKPQTELFGTAPYIALGRGVLRHTDTSSLLQQSNWVERRGSRSIAEIDYNRFEYVSIPKNLSALAPELRFGAMTRVAPAYLQPHD